MQGVGPETAQPPQLPPQSSRRSPPFHSGEMSTPRRFSEGLGDGSSALPGFPSLMQKDDVDMMYLPSAVPTNSLYDLPSIPLLSSGTLPIRCSFLLVFLPLEEMIPLAPTAWSFSPTRIAFPPSPTVFTARTIPPTVSPTSPRSTLPPTAVWTRCPTRTTTIPSLRALLRWLLPAKAAASTTVATRWSPARPSSATRPTPTSPRPSSTTPSFPRALARATPTWSRPTTSSSSLRGSRPPATSPRCRRPPPRSPSARRRLCRRGPIWEATGATRTAWCCPRRTRPRRRPCWATPPSRSRAIGRGLLRPSPTLPRPRALPALRRTEAS